MNKLLVGLTLVLTIGNPSIAMSQTMQPPIELTKEMQFEQTKEGCKFYRQLKPEADALLAIDDYGGKLEFVKAFYRYWFFVTSDVQQRLFMAESLLMTDPYRNDAMTKANLYLIGRGILNYCNENL